MLAPHCASLRPGRPAPLRRAQCSRQTPGIFFNLSPIFLCRNRPGRQFRGAPAGVESATIALSINRHAAATALDIRSRSASCSHWTTLPQAKHSGKTTLLARKDQYSTDSRECGPGMPGPYKMRCWEFVAAGRARSRKSLCPAFMGAGGFCRSKNPRTDASTVARRARHMEVSRDIPAQVQ